MTGGSDLAAILLLTGRMSVLLAGLYLVVLASRYPQSGAFPSVVTEAEGRDVKAARWIRAFALSGGGLILVFVSACRLL